MKKTLLISIVSGLLTAGCIDNSAIQKLNDSAQMYLNQSQPSKAVCRLEASKELNPNLYETRYNLGVAYIEMKDYKNAIAELNDAIKIKSDNPNVYYTLGVAYDSLGFEILDKNKTEDLYLTDEDVKNKPQQISEEEKNEGISYLSSAIEYYQKYLEKNPTAEDKSEVENQIEVVNTKISEYQKEN